MAAAAAGNCLMEGHHASRLISGCVRSTRLVDKQYGKCTAVATFNNDMKSFLKFNGNFNEY